MAAPASGPPAIHDLVADRLRRADQRYTTGRRRLIEALAAAERPVTIPELLGGRRDLPQSSAYRNLQILEQVGVVHRIVTTDEHARFELAAELAGHHHHLICTTCGKVDDFTASPQLERTIDNALTKVAEGAGFSLSSHRLDLVGVCADCA